MEGIKLSKNILIVQDTTETLNLLVDDLKTQTSGEITIKTVTDLNNAGSLASVYDFLLSATKNGTTYNTELLSVFLKVLKPNGILVIKNASNADNLLSQLKISGFVGVVKNGEEVTSSKPNFEIGSSAKLSFAGKKVETSSVWKIDNDLDDDVIDPDTLLDDDDLKKPEPESLRVCGTTGKRKACKDCSCGLAEELGNEAKPKILENAPKSSCGSCYLGDAFRCASCPYLGMPAFKPGEKIQLAGNQLQSDI